MPGSLLLSLPECLGVLWRSRYLSLLLFVAVMGAAVAGLAATPRTYISEAKLFVRVGRESITLDPTATTGQTISVYESRETELNSVLDVLRSRVVLERVVDKLSPAVVLGLVSPEPLASRLEPARETAFDRRVATKTVAAAAIAAVGPVPVTVEVPPPPEPLEAAVSRATSGSSEKAIKALERAVSVTQGKKSGVITISGKASSPDLARAIVQGVLDAFREEHIRIHRTQGSHEFFVNQVAVLERELNEAVSALRDAKNAVGLATVEGQRKLIQDKSALIEAQALDAEAAYAACEAGLTAMRKALEGFPDKQITQEVTGLPNDATDRTRQQLNDLRIKEQELLARFTERHPAVDAVRQQQTQAARNLEQLETQLRGRQLTSSVNPALQQLQVKVAEEEARAASLRARSASLREQSARLAGQLRQLNDAEGEIEQLQKRVELLQTTSKAYAEKLEQTRINTELEHDRITNVNVVQPPTYITEPAAPKKTMVLGAGLVAAVLTAIGVPVLVAQIRRAVPLLMQELRTDVGPTPASEAGSAAPPGERRPTTTTA